MKNHTQSDANNNNNKRKQLSMAGKSFDEMLIYLLSGEADDLPEDIYKEL